MGSVPTLLLKELVKTRESVSHKIGYWLIVIYRLETISGGIVYDNIAMGMYEYPVLKINEIEDTISRLLGYCDAILKGRLRHYVRWEREYFEVHEGNRDSSIHS